ncbi:MAG: hypothetical protein NXI16_14965 [Alphaproteobacteria bacterium]|nr:hypothetical protein [Alphaproteobacteria bacterium]
MISFLSFEGLPLTNRERISFETATPRQPGTWFERDVDRETLLRIAHGEQTASIPVENLVNASEVRRSAKELDMFGIVEVGLSYQPRLAQGDPVPTELTTGAPSWSAPEDLRGRVLSGLMEKLHIPKAENSTAVDHSAQIAGTIVQEIRETREIDVEETIAVIEKALHAIECVSCLGGVIEQRRNRVAEMAQLAAEKAAGIRNDILKETAVHLHKSTCWAHERQKILRAATGNLISLVKSPAPIETQIWPEISVLRAWWMDTEPLLTLWAEAMEETDTPRPKELELLHRNVCIRLKNLDTDLYHLQGFIDDLLFRRDVDEALAS